MQLVKTTVYVEFETALSPWLGVRDLIRVASGNSDLELQGQPLIVDQAPIKQRVTHQVRSIAIEQEGKPSVIESTKSALSVLDKTNQEIPLPRVLKIRSDAMFIEPYPLPFYELVALIKDRFLQGNRISESTTDISVSLDYHEDKQIKHLLVGPMEPAQLRSQYLRWPSEDLPDCFVFMSLGIERNQQVAFDTKELETFLETTTQWQSSQAKDTLDILTRVGG